MKMKEGSNSGIERCVIFLSKGLEKQQIIIRKTSLKDKKIIQKYHLYEKIYILKKKKNLLWFCGEYAQTF